MSQQDLLDPVSIQSDPRPSLISAASHFYSQGWMVGTAGNLSAKMPDGSFWITASGMSKGELSHNKFVRVYPDGYVFQAAPEFKPSAETSIHQAIYERFPDAQACYHVHSVEANLVSDFTEADEILLPALEMLKGLGLGCENPNCMMPLFANHFHVPQIAADIKQRFQDHPPQIPALLIRNHGVTVWGNSLEVTRNRIEIAEYIFRYMVAKKGVNL